MTKQCPTRVPCNTHTLICVRDDGHSGRHKDSDGGTWERRGTALIGNRPLKTHRERDRYFDRERGEVAFNTTCGRVVYGEARISRRPTCAVCWFQV